MENQIDLEITRMSMIATLQDTDHEKQNAVLINILENYDCSSYPYAWAYDEAWDSKHSIGFRADWSDFFQQLVYVL